MSWDAPVDPGPGAGAPAAAQSHESFVYLAPEEEPLFRPALKDSLAVASGAGERRTSWLPGSGVADKRGGPRSPTYVKYSNLTNAQ